MRNPNRIGIDTISREYGATKFKTGRVKKMMQLTAAQKRVIALVSLAKTNKEIAVALGISPATVKRHLENILSRLQLKNRVEAAIYGLRSAGCPHGFDLACPLKNGQQEINLTDEKWAV